jgi:hypothetical protein
MESSMTTTLPEGHIIIEAADTLDGRVAQTIERPDGTDYVRLVDADEAYRKDGGEA